jgi:chromosome segregation ATPase
MENTYMDKSQRRGTRLWHVLPFFAGVCSFVLSLCIAVSSGTCSPKDAVSGACGELTAVKQELELTKQSLNSYKGLYERKDKEISALNAKLNKLQEGFDKFQEISDRLTQEKEALMRQQSQLATQLKQLEGQKRALEQQNKMLAECDKESKQKSLDIAALTSLSKTETNELSQKLRSTQGQIDSAMQNNKDLTRKNAELQTRYGELAVRVAELEKNNVALGRQKESALEKAQGLAKEVELVKAKLLTAQTENARLKGTAEKVPVLEGAAAELERSRKDLAQLRDENKKLGAAVLKVKDIEALQQEAALLRNEVAGLEKENKRLLGIESKYKSQEGSSMQAADLRKKVEQLADENQKLNKDSAAAGRGQQACQASVSTLRDELAAAKQQNEKLKSTIGKAGDVQAQKLELEQARNKLAQLEKAKTQLWNAYSEKVKNQKGLIDELIDLRMRIGQSRMQSAQLEEENKKLRVGSGSTPSQDALVEELRQIREELARTDAENKKLRGAVVALPTRDKALQEEVKALKAEAADLKDENAKLRQNPLAVRQQGYDQGVAVGLQRELDKSRKDFVELQVRCEQIEKENIRLKQATAQLQDQEALNKEAAALREKLGRAEQERDLLRTELNENRKQDGFIEGLKQGYEKELGQLHAELEKVESENRKLVEESVRLKKFEASTQDMAEARRQIIKLTEEKQAMQRDLDAVRIKQDNIVDQLVKVRKEKEVLEDNYRGKAGNQIERLQQELKDAQQLSMQLVQEKATFQGKEKKLTYQIASLESQNSQMEKTIAQLNSKLDILNTEHSKLSEQLAQTMVKLSESEKEKQVLASQAESTSREIADLRSQFAQAQDMAQKTRDEMYQLRKTNAELTEQNTKIVGGRAQEIALFNTQMEQLKAHKDGELSALNQKFAKYRSDKEAEIVGSAEKLSKLQQELQNAQAMSLQLMQDKTGFSSQQKQLNEEYKKLQSQNMVMAGQVKKLEDQNAFLKSQFITASQEAADLKRLTQGGQKGAQPEARYLDELRQIKKELLRKSEQLRLYEQPGGGGLSKQYTDLVDQHTRLKQQYEMLQAKNKQLEAVRKQFEDFKTRSGKLPDENATLHYNLSVLYAQNQDYPKAIAELEKVIELKPSDGEAYYNLGVIYGEYLNNRKKAIQYFKKYLALSPKDADADRIRKYVLTYETFGQE